ncbi:unnamed protein product [Rhizophagus irregularis]|nr:unnamed protein product [Rhizophagus irregularis]
MSQAEPEIPIASTSGISAANEPPQIINTAVARPESEHVVNPNPEPKPSRTSRKGKEAMIQQEVTPQKNSPPTINPARAQREKRLRKWAIDNG